MSFIETGSGEDPGEGEEKESPIGDGSDIGIVCQSLSSASKPRPAIDIDDKVALAQPVQQKGARQKCHRCNFPQRTCVCPSLPNNLFPLFQKCRILVLQHPHELRRANSSLPLVELCLFGRRKFKESSDAPTNENKFVMKTVVGRRFGDHCDADAMKVLRDPNEVVVLVFPHKLAMDFEEGLRIAEERCRVGCSEGNGGKIDEQDVSQGTYSAALIGEPKRKKMTIVFIDATWKHAREMEAATDAAGEWPENTIRVQMTPSSSGNSRVDVDDASWTEANVGSSIESRSKTQDDNSESQSFIQRRFLIRTPPSPDHLSTAECIAWIASRIENNPLIYESITKVLDYMVERWKGCTNPDIRKRSGKSEMSQKKLKISTST